MPNANFTPIGPDRKWWPKVDFDGSALPPASSTTGGAQAGNANAAEPQAHVQQLPTNACRKCGYTGHLAYQCRNFIQLKPNQKVDVDVSSTSSEEYETQLRSKNNDEKKRQKELEKTERREKRRLRKEQKRLKKERKKEKKLKKSRDGRVEKHSKHRRRSSSSSSAEVDSRKARKRSPSRKRKHHRHHRDEGSRERKRHRRRSSS